MMEVKEDQELSTIVFKETNSKKVLGAAKTLVYVCQKCGLIESFLRMKPDV